MLLTILKYYLNIFKNVYTIILGAPHNLQVISKSSDTEMATFLAENSKKIDDKNLNLEVTIRLAVCFKKETVLEFLAKNGENENEVSIGDTVLHIGYTMLHIAAMGGYTETASFLIEKGAIIDSESTNGDTPLYVAAKRGYTETARFLIEKGAKVDSETSNGETPLYMAAKRGYTETAKILIENCAKVDAKQTWRNTSLYGC